MGEIKIRLAQDYDAARICAINMDSLGYDHPIEKTRERLHLLLLRDTDRIFVACASGDVIGYVHACDYECIYCNPLKNIMAIAVDSQYRGMGAGRMLLSAVEQWAKENSCAGVRLVSGFNRQAAHDFYTHCGYRHRKDQKNFIRIWGDTQ